MYPEPITARFFFYTDRIVQISGIIAVDRDDQFVSQIAAAKQILRLYLLRNLLDFFHDRIRETRFNIVRQKNREYVDAGIVFISKDL